MAIDCDSSNDNFFSFSSSITFIISIIIYLYYLILDYKEQNDKNRPVYKKIWIWGFFILLFCGFFLSSYCLYKRI